jgi:hypothetical protein
MFTQETTARRRSRLARALVALALTAVVVVVSQASSIRSTRIDPQVPRFRSRRWPPDRVDRHPPSAASRFARDLDDPRTRREPNDARW